MPLARPIYRSTGDFRRLKALVTKIHAAQDNSRWRALEFPGEEFARGALFDPVAQPQKLRVALIGFCLHAAFEVVHRGAADGATNLLVAVQHREQHDHPVMLKTDDGSAIERHLIWLALPWPTADRFPRSGAGSRPRNHAGRRRRCR